MHVINKLVMLSVGVSDMTKAKEFYADKLGLTLATDYRHDDHNWWVSLTLPDGVSITLTTFHENMKPGTMKLYFATSDIVAAREAIIAKGSKPGEIKNDLYGPGSGVKWFSLEDPDGNQVLVIQA